MKTLLLDQDNWDLVLDTSGNIALASEPYAVAQDVASSARLFAGELWYDTAKGIPYFSQVLGYLPPASLLNEYYKNAALSVPTVEAVTMYLEPLANRELSGQIQFTTNQGETGSVNF